MNDHQQWLDANTQYLRTAIHWVQARLERHIVLTAPIPPAPKPVVAEPRRRYFWFGLHSHKPTPKPPTKAPEDLSSLAAIDTTLEKLATELSAAETAPLPSALIIIARQLGLSDFERDILLLCAALELDGKTAGLCAKAQGGLKPYPTFALALQLFDHTEWDALSAHRPLRYWRLVDINQPNTEPLSTSALRIDERIVNYLVEPKHQLDDRLLPFVIKPRDGVQTGGQEDVLAPSQVQQAQSLSHYIERQAGRNADTSLLVQLVGPDTQAKLAIAQHSLAGHALELVQLSLENIPGHIGELENLLRLWGRERQLLPIALYLDTDSDTETTQQKAVLQRVIANAGGIVILASRDPNPALNGFTLEVDKPNAIEQQTAWAKVLGPENQSVADQLAGQFSLDLASIHRIGTGVVGDNNGTLQSDELKHQTWAACLLKTSPKLDQLAQRLDVKATWDQLVLPSESLTLLQQITDQVGLRTRVFSDWGFQGKMNRGLGLSVLFAGESGTGKTMAAEVIANALDLNLYRIDLSAVVSKYIGETEKNLRRLFDAAEDGGAILFFDEADALFGKRSDVKDSHDRYANIEINYLLQRIEAYRGLAILATNMKSSLDQAFMRRLRFIINFTFPAAAQRADIWRKVFPPQTPVGELDYQHLGRFNLTGGSIHNIALNAAFLAARNPQPQITMALIFEAIRGELRKLDKPVNEAEFRALNIAGAKP